MRRKTWVAAVVSKLPSFIRFRHIFLVKYSFLLPSYYPHPKLFNIFLSPYWWHERKPLLPVWRNFFIIYRHSLNINFFHILSLRQFYIISLLRHEKTGWRQSLQDALYEWLCYLVLAHWLLATLATDLFHSDREILVGHFAFTITVQYSPSLKSVVLLEVNITGCNQRYCNSSPLVVSILTLPATVEAQEDHYTRYYYAHWTVGF